MTLQEAYEREGIVKKTYFYIDNSTAPIEDMYIHQGSFKLTRNICTDSNLRFGGCLSSYISCRLSNGLSKLKNKKITVNQIINDTVVPLGKFYVDTDTPSTDKKYRDITAYDILYKKKSIDMTDWYSRLIFPMTLKTFRDLFFAFLEIQQVNITLPNDNMVLVQNQNNTSSIIASQIMSDICSVNGCFGRINEQELFDYVFLQKDNALTINKTLQKKLSYEDYTTHDINQLKFTQTNMDADFYFGSGENQYPLSLSVLCTHADDTHMSNVCGNVFPYIAGIKFTPMDLTCRGNLVLYPGQLIKTYGYNDEDLYTYALQQTYTFLSDEGITGQYIADGTEFYTRDISDNSQAIYDIDNEINTIYRNNFYAYTFTNEQDFTVTGTEKTIIKFNISATSETDVIFVATIPIVMRSDARIIIDYLLDASVIEKDRVTMLLQKGEQLIPLTNFLPVGQDGRLTLTISIKIEYEETENRIQNANIISLTEYVKTGTYKEPTVDTTVLDGSIKKNAIRAVIFAKGLAGEIPWDGTLNITDSVPLFNISKSSTQLDKLSDSVICALNKNTANDFSDIAGAFNIQSQSIKLQDTIEYYSYSFTQHFYVLNANTLDELVYNLLYVDTANLVFELRTEYEYLPDYEQIDAGTLQTISIDTTRFSDIIGGEVIVE